jgi:hypothetical protein
MTDLFCILFMLANSAVDEMPREENERRE